MRFYFRPRPNDWDPSGFADYDILYERAYVNLTYELAREPTESELDKYIVDDLEQKKFEKAEYYYD